MKKTNYFLILLIFISLPSIAIGKKKQSVNSLKDKLSKQVSVVSQLGAKIRTIEKNLGSMNDDYLVKTQEIKKLDKVIIEMRQLLSGSASDISKSYSDTKKILNHYLLDVADERTHDKLLKRKIYITLLQKKLKELEAAQEGSQTLLVTLKEYEDRLDQSRKDEGALYNLLVDLEEQKKSLGQQYVSQLETKNSYEESLEEAIARKKVKRKQPRVSRSNVKVSLRKPLDSYISAKGSKKGVTFKFNKVAPVYASGSGKVVYAGELASYGRVIMVDHGQEIRSVILGDISIKVKKGDMIRKGSVLAYTNSDPGLTKSLYYEVRKKNIAQNTLNILKKSNKNI